MQSCIEDGDDRALGPRLCDETRRCETATGHRPAHRGESDGGDIDTLLQNFAPKFSGL